MIIYIICIATCFLQTNLFPDIHMYWLMVTTSDGWVDWLFFTSLCLSADAAVVAFDRVPRLKRTLSLRRVWGSGHHQSMKSPGKSLGKFHQRHFLKQKSCIESVKPSRHLFLFLRFRSGKLIQACNSLGTRTCFSRFLCVFQVCVERALLPFVD